MSANRHQVFDEVVLAGGCADFAAPAAALGAVERERRALDIAAVGDGDEHVFFDDQVFDREVALGLDNLGAARVAEFLFDVFDFRGDERAHLAFVVEQPGEPRDRLLGLLVLGVDFVALQRGQAAQRQVEDRLGLESG